MIRIIKKSTKIILKTILGLTAFILIYALVVFITSIISVNKNTSTGAHNTIPVYILSNGVHTDVVLPLKNNIKDWSTSISYLHTKAQDSTRKLLAFGWGDKGFYLDTPTWSDLKASTAIKAVTGISTSAMHLTFYKELHENKQCKKFFITEKDYRQLIAYIENSFVLNSEKKIQRIGTYSYGKYDVFYEAKGSYSLFYTCNTWANQALKAGNQKAALWTVLDKGIFYHYE
ncbi:TIGR02117 family protein [Flavobacterium sp. J27]|uniref:TIGR02117 family protein n=1 Tax=Flavobacterium sp. J27 TaxID=2060419 RepID=UPI001F0EFFF7|nr:TIGR02117 family protein [Flavobacterium sp. J27]